MPASPPVPAAAIPAPDNCKTRRRSMRVIRVSPCDCLSVIPAKAAIQEHHGGCSWTPTFAGVTISVSTIDLHQFAMRPLDGVLGRHALDRLCIHVDDDVLGPDLGRLAIGCPGIAVEPAEAGQVLEWQQHRVDVP